MMHYWGPTYTRSFSFWPGGIIEFGVTILFWVAVVFLLLTLLKSFKNHGGKSEFDEHGDEALSILKKRYAKGEIDKKQFDEMKKVIE